MNKKIAFDNRLCYERDVARQHAIHHHKLQTMLPTSHSPSKVYMDSNEPARQAHLAVNRKRLQVEKEKQLEIYMQNQRLANKMEHILNRQENIVLAAGTPISPKCPTARGGAHVGASRSSSPSLSPKKPHKPAHSPAYVHMPGIRLDANQTPMVDCYLSPEFAMGRGNACKKNTLINRGVQRLKEQRIAEENRRLKQRLNEQKPYYSAKKWDNEWQQSAKKFQHMHQNGTVGYLLPKAASDEANSRALRSPHVSRRVKAPNGLPLIKPGSHHGRGGRLKEALAGNSSSSNSSGEFEDPVVIDCPPFPLLEATTRKGVEVVIEEMQIELVDPSSGIVQPGDRGLTIKGKWKDAEGECLISYETLERVAQEIDDLEMMIKLETVSTLTGMGNFPRLSLLLAEDELQSLLLKLVQALNIQLLEQEKQLILTNRFIKSSSPITKDRYDPCRTATRPRTCPSTLSTEAPHTQTSRHQFDSPAVSADEKERFDFLLRKQLAHVLERHPRKTGMHCAEAYSLIEYRYCAEDSKVLVNVIKLSCLFPRVDVVTLTVNTSDVSNLLEELQSGDDRALWRWILKQLQ